MQRDLDLAIADLEKIRDEDLAALRVLESQLRSVVRRSSPEMEDDGTDPFDAA